MWTICGIERATIFPPSTNLWELLKKWIQVAIKAEFDAYWEKIKLLAPLSLIVYFEKHWLNDITTWSAIYRQDWNIFVLCDTNMLVKKFGFEGVNLEVKEHIAIEKRAESIPASAITPEKLEDGTQSLTAFHVQSQSDSELSHVIKELEHFDKTLLPPRKKVAPNQGSWRETANVMGVEVKGSKKRKHTDAYAGGEQLGSSAKPDAKVSLRSKVTKISQAVPAVQLLQIPAIAVPSVPPDLQHININDTAALCCLLHATLNKLCKEKYRALNQPNPPSLPVASPHPPALSSLILPSIPSPTTLLPVMYYPQSNIAPPTFLSQS
ncbi:hypothetical protein BT96DRAFT_950528 [Gymnopus androsaceus JB14]|uniref:Uncharacterized protein n=1 Tax=Gymnopus androsaceus JB14 TaxID=1447944 RepID=A0A6A4GG90_9AGAR|nr:hypothetical protein BT96DRAFT_950528 [Gymnopus androsaceus JB14]